MATQSNDFNKSRGELKAELASIGAKINRLQCEQLEIKKQLTVANKRREELNRLIKNIVETFSVTDHAVLRYLERVLDLDTEEIREMICDEKLTDKIKKSGDGKYTISPGIVAVVKDRSVVTIVRTDE